MRPQGELRQALRKAAESLAPAGSGGVTWHALVRRACVGELMGRRTVENMVRSGELEIAGAAAEPGICRPMRLLRLPAEPEPERPRGLALQEAWASAI